MSGKLTLINDRVNGQGNGDSRNASVDPSAAPDLSDYALGVVVAILLPIFICAVLLQAAVLLAHPEARVIDPTSIFFP